MAQYLERYLNFYLTGDVLPWHDADLRVSYYANHPTCRVSEFEDLDDSHDFFVNSFTRYHFTRVFASSNTGYAAYNPPVAAIYNSAIQATLDEVACEGIAVTNTNDSGPGSLRQAILDANANPGSDVIQFSIPGYGPYTIRPNSPLEITDPVVLDGYTQPGAAPAPELSAATLLIELDGTNAEPDASGLTISAGNTTVRGLVINRFEGAGIFIHINGGNIIEDNFIGTDVTGIEDRGNWNGIQITGGASNNTIAHNLISGNGDSDIGGTGIFIHPEEGTTIAGNIIEDNFIGTDVTGTIDLGNSLNGVQLSAGAGYTTIAGNVISGNGNSGVGIVGTGATGNQVQGNFIGTNSNGTAALGNMDGVWLGEGAANNTIGGVTPGARNVISGNDGGVSINNPGTTGNLVQGNYIGTDVSGTAALANTIGGVVFTTGASANLIGGTEAGAGNTIAFNAKAQKEMDKAAEEIGKDHYDKAIDHYKKAWGHTQKAMKKGPEPEGVAKLVSSTGADPERFSLLQNHPNPFNPATTIAYTLPQASDVSLTIYTVTGQRVGILVSAHQAAGRYEVAWDGSRFANGIYFYRLEAGAFVQTQRMLLLK